MGESSASSREPRRKGEEVLMELVRINMEMMQLAYTVIEKETKNNSRSSNTNCGSNNSSNVAAAITKPK